VQRLQGNGQKDMGLLLQVINFRVFYNGLKSISHNNTQGRPFPIMIATKKVDSHRVEMSTANVIVHNVLDKTAEAKRKKRMSA